MVTRNASSTDPIRVLFLAAEADPFVKVGGLGDVAGSLPPALQNLLPEDSGGRKIEIRLVIPFHGVIDQRAFTMVPVSTYPVQTDEGSLLATVYYSEIRGVPVYLIGGDPITQAPGVYSFDAREDGAKFAFFSIAALELARKLNWHPDIIHANDWHTALSVYMLSLIRAKDKFFQKTRSVLTVHNLPFMGAGAESSLHVFRIPPSTDERLPEWARQLPLPLGLLAADEIVAVSPTYAQEILTPEFGCGLQEFLQSRQASLTGILNGVDMQAWDPVREQNGVMNYSVENLDLRQVNKSALQNRFSMLEDPTVPLLAFIGRMDPQKGVDLILQSLQQLSELAWQAIILGTGVPGLEADARQLEIDFPDRVRSVIRFDGRLSHQLYAGADVLMMPSRYEPCGLAQMIAMRYGCIPVARATGGLRDTIRDFFITPDSTGFLFQPASADALTNTLRSAVYTYPNQVAWRGLQTRSMQQDFGWQRSAAAYARLYLNLIRA